MISCVKYHGPKQLIKHGRGPKLEGCAFANFGISSGARGGGKEGHGLKRPQQPRVADP